MFQTKGFYKFIFLGVSAFLLNTSASAATSSNIPNNNNNHNSIEKNKNTKTNELIVFEQDDEQEAYAKNGFTRGDFTKLYDFKFNTSDMTNISGEVAQVFRVKYPDNDCYLIAILSTKANNGKVAVNLGPIWFLEENNFSVNENDNIEVKGAKVRTNGRFILVATELTKNGNTLNIRDDKGTPLWGSPQAQKGAAYCEKPISKYSSK